MVVEAHAVDDCRVLLEAEHAWLGVARLRARRDGADFHMAKTKAGECINGLCILVQPGSKADAVGESQAHHFDLLGFCNLVSGHPAAEMMHSPNRKIVGGFRVQAEEYGTGEGI